MWRELVGANDPDLEFYPAATINEINTAETAVGMPFPPELHSLYLETNGVYSIGAYMYIVYPLNELVKENRYMHTSPDLAFYEKSFDDLFFFGTLGNGDLFAFRYDHTSRTYPSVGRWNHETGDYEEDAKSLRETFET